MPCYATIGSVTQWWKGFNLGDAQDRKTALAPELQKAYGVPKFLPGQKVTMTQTCGWDNTKAPWVGEGTVSHIWRKEMGALDWYTVQGVTGPRQCYGWSLAVLEKVAT